MTVRCDKADAVFVIYLLFIQIAFYNGYSAKKAIVNSVDPDLKLYKNTPNNRWYKYLISKQYLIFY